LGGRLDSTTIITPVVSLITNISLDHTDTWRYIEKMGGKKRHHQTAGNRWWSVSYQWNLPPSSPRWQGNESSGGIADKNYKVVACHKGRCCDEDQSGLTGIPTSRTHTPWTHRYYQLRNVLWVLNTVEFIDEGWIQYWSRRMWLPVIAGSQTHRFARQVGNAQKEPQIIADTGHNAEGIKQVVKPEE